MRHSIFITFSEFISNYSFLQRMDLEFNKQIARYTDTLASYLLHENVRRTGPAWKGGKKTKSTMQPCEILAVFDLIFSTPAHYLTIIQDKRIAIFLCLFFFAFLLI